VLTAYGERYLFVPVKLIHSIEDRLSASFGSAIATGFQYEIGKEGGEEYIRIAEKAGYKLRSIRDLNILAEQMGTLSGWGKVEVMSVDYEKKSARIRWTNGISVRSKKGKTVVCHFGRGILAGAFDAIFGKRCESLEISCEGKGDAYCEAVFGDPVEIARVAETMKT
jgi:predicted hydrocarbon binding protein